MHLFVGMLVFIGCIVFCKYLVSKALTELPEEDKIKVTEMVGRIDAFSFIPLIILLLGFVIYTVSGQNMEIGLNTLAVLSIISLIVIALVTYRKVTKLELPQSFLKKFHVSYAIQYAAAITLILVHIVDSIANS